MHVQIIRGIAIGLALIMYGREEGAETLIEQMTRDQDPILRCTQQLMCFLHVVTACRRAAAAAPLADIQAQCEVKVGEVVSSVVPAVCIAAESPSPLALMECLRLALCRAEQSHAVLLCAEHTRT